MNKPTKKTLLTIVLFSMFLLTTGATILVKDAGWFTRQLKTSYQTGTDTLPPADQVHALNVVTTSYPHHKNHTGENFNWCTIDTLGSGSSKDYLINGFDTTDPGIHFFAQVTSTGEAEVRFLEAPTWVPTTNLQAVTVWNHNRTSSIVSAVDVNSITNLVNNGDLLCVQVVGAGQSSGSSFRSVNEWVLSPDTNYILRLTSRAASNTLTAVGNHYETVDPY